MCGLFLIYCVEIVLILEKERGSYRRKRRLVLPEEGMEVKVAEQGLV